MVGIEHNDNWSADGMFIMNVNELERTFLEAKFRNDYQHMYHAVESIELLIAPKLKEEEAEKFRDRVRYISGGVHKIPIVSEGRQIGERVNIKFSVIRDLIDLFRNMLITLQRHGIYTKQIRDRKKALGGED